MERLSVPGAIGYCAGGGWLGTVAGASGSGWWSGCVLSIQPMLSTIATKIAMKVMPKIKERNAMPSSSPLYRGVQVAARMPHQMGEAMDP